MASAAAVAPLLCPATGSVSFAPGPDAWEDPLPQGLTLAAAPAATVHAGPVGASSGATSVDIVEPLVASGGVSLPENPAVPGQVFKIGRASYTIDYVHPYDGVNVDEATPGHALLYFHPGLSATLAGGAALALQATTLTSDTAPYVSTANDETITVDGGETPGGPSPCSSIFGDFAPDTADLSFVINGSGDAAAASLEGRSSAIAADIQWPGSQSGWTNDGFPDSVVFTPARAAFCASSGEFDIEGNGITPTPAGNNLSDPCTSGTFYYTGGRVTGTYATTVANQQLTITGVALCTENQVLDGASVRELCDGQSDSSVSTAQAGEELLNAETYDESGGDCLTGGNGWTSGSCSAPNGSDGSPVTLIVGLQLAGSGSL